MLSNSVVWMGGVKYSIIAQTAEVIRLRSDDGDVIFVYPDRISGTFTLDKLSEGYVKDMLKFLHNPKVRRIFTS